MVCCCLLITKKYLREKKEVNTKVGVEMEKSIEDAQVSILIELDGKVHMVGMSKDRLEAISILIRNAVDIAIPTNKTQQDLRDFLGYKG